MSNHWADIANSTCVVVWGANPAENHPACIAHVGRARFPKQFFPATDPRSLKKPAQLIVIDPRKNRTALLCDEANGDKFVRIRPGTDIALINGLVRYIIEKMEAGNPAVAPQVGFFNHLNETSNGSFFTDGSAATSTAVSGEAITLSGTTASALAHKSISATATVFYASGYPATGAIVAASGYVLNSGAGTIARTATSFIPTGTPLQVDYSFGGFSALDTAVSGSSKYTDARFLVTSGANDYERGTRNPGAENQISNFPLKATSVTGDPNTVYNRLKAHVAPYTLAVVADICGIADPADITFIGDAYIANSKCSTTASNKDARDPSFRALTMLYAMGITQHTCGAQNVKGFALLQTLMGNMGRQGGGINALRGIHNVQGSTDMGLLNGNIPAYSSNPTVQTDGGPVWSSGSPLAPSGQAFAQYVDKLWGTPLNGTGNKTTMNGSYDDAYNTTTTGLGAMALQQRGFYNMTLKWFGDYATTTALATPAQKRPTTDAAYSLWPKGNGHDHITMFRAMGATSGVTKAAIVWGQNPAVTEPNQGAVRAGLSNLDLLVCVDMFETETAAVSRKAGGVTFLIPSASHVEKAGSSTNSGRTLQWRYQATLPKGNSKDDTELLLRLAKALDTQGGFAHIKNVWDNNGVFSATGNVYQKLYSDPYGGFSGTSGFNALSGVAEKANLNSLVTSGQTTYVTGAVVTGSEWVAESIYRETMAPSAVGGTLWIYTGAYNSGATWTTDQTHAAAASGVMIAGSAATVAQGTWAVKNRAKSRDRRDGNYQMAFPGWGYCWLVNRRVFYNNTDVPGDVADFYMGPDSCSRLFTSTNTAKLNYSRWYRTIHLLKDKPSPVLAASLASPHYAGGMTSTVSFAGAFPGHTEPYETPRSDDAAFMAKWGRNTKNVAAWDLVRADTKVAGRGLSGDPTAATYPLVLTTIRCVEHFQGGPITRNNPFTVELEPVPWIEINSADAIVNGINNGDMVKVVTARTGDLVNQELPLYGDGFEARVGVGLSTGQRVGPGVVAIPWHWGDKGLSTGSRANDLTIDAADANTVIPEYKACLCRIEKI